MSVQITPKPLSLNYRAIAEDFAELAVAAGAAVMLFYNSDSHAREKGDTSPVCDADLAGEAVILAGLAARLPDLPVISEEAAAAGAKATCGDAFILVDPVDGTREFLAGKGEFTVNIGLVVHGEPKIGAVYAPALEQMWLAGDHAVTFPVAPGGKLPPPEQRQRIHTRKPDQDGLIALTSWSHTDPRTSAFLENLNVKQRRMIGSSLKFCSLADGSADIYPRFGATMEWDTAAGDAVLRAAGGIVLDRDGLPLRYGKAATKFMNGSFVAWADPAAIQATLGARRA
ncbi:3'(2'),5'-bisphosphate nucleotidase [Methylovirgula ligni]|uniref:3'(2'),5'-bisphosphate nucleotidase CysQ n=1 Tax=Methylovirgula ligni TaxID=569860 RepID=A0A3D9Z106_9HYPH|nr:3'(2'),5'-bisphosphate nucleotidase CysQ [Methylovirgula ligni]QAY95771.1 3'(2'),5'-bisphosphate nucleotidase [Methylovirgula ligni]REF88852.1 3'(2'),5'-bisphosphate nucleotidase [Methylovirgula ligni]